MKAFNVGDKVRLTAKAKRLSYENPAWWGIMPSTISAIQAYHTTLTVSESVPGSYIELKECLPYRFSWNPELFTKRGLSD